MCESGGRSNKEAERETASKLESTDKETIKFMKSRSGGTFWPRMKHGPDTDGEGAEWRIGVVECRKKEGRKRAYPARGGTKRGVFTGSYRITFFLRPKSSRILVRGMIGRGIERGKLDQTTKTEIERRRAGSRRSEVAKNPLCSGWSRCCDWRFAHSRAPKEGVAHGMLVLPHRAHGWSRLPGPENQPCS